jgi:transcriptional regulator with AAA-type ATPase domain
MRASPNHGVGILALLFLPPALIVLWAKSAPPARGEDWVSPSTRTAMRAVGLGGALLAAARVAPAGDPLFEAVASLGTTMASAGSLVALARIAPLGGMLVVPERARRLGTAIFVGVMGAAATALPLWQTAGGARTPSAEVVEATTSFVAAASLVLTVLAAFRLRRLRRFDLGASERLSAVLTSACVATVVGVPASLLGYAPSSHVLATSAWLAALVATAACLAHDPTFVARAQRVLVAVTILGAPVGLFAASTAHQAPTEGVMAAILALAAGIAIGLVGPPVARPLGPEQSRWIDAFESATNAALRSEPETAVTSALATLRQGFGPTASTPELWSVDPAELHTVDRAGYAHVEPNVTVPKLLYDLAEGEPERTMRTEVLETLEVRRADIRPALEWLRGRGAMSFTLMNDEDGPLGALVLPIGARTHPLTLEEVRALRTLCDRLTALLSVSSSLARSRAQKLAAEKSAELEGERAAHLEHLVASSAGRNEALARRAAHRALVAPYSAASRLALEELGRLSKAGAPVGLLTPPGVDPVPYAAYAHGAGPRREGPFVVVDAAGPDEQQPLTWRDPKTSPLCLADGGTLFISSVAALDPMTQAFLAESIVQRRSPADHAAPLDLALVVSVPTTVDSLVASGQLHSDLADALGDRAVPLPPLSARADDLRALFLDRLARIGMRLKGRAFGADPRALARLVEHGWPGNEVELDDVLTRAVAIADGELLTVAHLDQIGFVAAPLPMRRSARASSPGTHPLGS